MNKFPETPSRRKQWIIGSVVLTVVLAAFAFAHWQARTRAAAAAGKLLTFAVRRGPLVISLSESGTIQAQDKIVIKSEITGRTTILWVIDEGTQVKKDDLLVELDASALEDERFSQQIKVQNAEADFVRAREDLAITRNQAESDIEKAETALSFSEQDLNKYIEGEYPQLLREAEVRITLAEEDLQRAAEKLKWSRVLFEQKFISQTELQADELSERKADLELELARGKKSLLEQHTHKRDVAELKSNAKQNVMALERVSRKAKANILQGETDLSAKEMEFKRQRDKLAEIESQIKATRIVAPSDGLVVYATSAQSGHWRNNTEPLAEGREVREREALIHLPDTAKMMASIKVHETHVKRITIGMAARITVDALPNMSFPGQVKQIAPLPDAGSSWMNPDLKVYDTEVYIANNAEGLRSGMTCEVELVAETHTNALYVPIQSVVRIKGEPTVFVVADRGAAVPRSVKIGGDNNRMIHVLDGLVEGERVLLAPPLRNSERDSSAAPPEPAKAGPEASPKAERQRDRKRKTP